MKRKHLIHLLCFLSLVVVVLVQLINPPLFFTPPFFEHLVFKLLFAPKYYSHEQPLFFKFNRLSLLYLALLLDLTYLSLVPLDNRSRLEKQA
jgi:hypothetical protein